MAKSSDKDLYTILGIAHDATPEQIHEAYRWHARITHPDRFDPKLQPEDWKHANEMLSEINEAYAILHDDLSRFQYDRHRAAQHFHQQAQSSQGLHPSHPPPASSAEQHPHPHHAPASEFIELTAGCAKYKDLAKHIQDRLRHRQENKGQDQFQIALASVTWNYLFIPILLGWFGYLFLNAEAGKWTSSALLLRGGITLAMAFFMGHHALAIFGWTKYTLKPYFYVTPLYFIKTDRDIVRFWPLFELKDVEVTHHYRDSPYQTSDIVLRFEGHDEFLSLSSKKKADVMVHRLKTFGFRLRAAYDHGDHSYLKRHNDFFHHRSTHAAALESPSPTNWEQMGAYIACLLFCAMGLMVALSINTAVVPLQWIRHPAPTLVMPPPERVKNPSVLPQPLPYSGSMSVYTTEERIAPFQIRAESGSHYFVKFSEAISNVPILTVFVQGGTTVQVNVPLGTYQVQYAAGITWYDLEYLFGPDTRYHRIDQLFTPQIAGNKIRGFTLTLSDSSMGKMSASAINGMAF